MCFRNRGFVYPHEGKGDGFFVGLMQVTSHDIDIWPDEVALASGRDVVGRLWGSGFFSSSGKHQQPNLSEEDTRAFTSTFGIKSSDYVVRAGPHVALATTLVVSQWSGDFFGRIIARKVQDHWVLDKDAGEFLVAVLCMSRQVYKVNNEVFDQVSWDEEGNASLLRAQLGALGDQVQSSFVLWSEEEDKKKRLSTAERRRVKKHGPSSTSAPVAAKRRYVVGWAEPRLSRVELLM